jgi:hypothetical protein
MTKPSTTAAESDRAREAERIAHRYQLRISPTNDGLFTGSAVEMPLVLVTAPAEGIVRATQAALVAAVAALLRAGRQPPPPQGIRRTHIVNIRMSDDERAVVETAARQLGFRGVSDYLRSLGLAPHSGEDKKAPRTNR